MDLIEQGHDERPTVTTVRPAYFNTFTRTVPKSETQADISLVKLYLGIRYFDLEYRDYAAILDFSYLHEHLSVLAGAICSGKHRLVLQGSGISHSENSVLVLASQVGEDAKRGGRSVCFRLNGWTGTHSLNTDGSVGDRKSSTEPRRKAALSLRYG